jgi:hypothetical protein
VDHLDHSQWVNTTRAAAILGCRRQDVRRVASLGGVRSRKLPTCSRRYYEPDLYALLRKSTANGVPPEPILAPARTK